MTGLLDLLRGPGRFLRRTVSGVAHLAGRVLAKLRDLVIAATRRHGTRWRSDSTYRRTLAAALAAVGGTLLPHPAAAAAIGAWLADAPTSRHVSRFLDDAGADDDGDDEDDQPRWTTSTRPSSGWTGPRNPWDAHN